MNDDPEFEDFLRRRRLFRRDVDDGLEPPPELDRIVLRRAREAIEGDRPERFFGMPKWVAPMAIAATLVLGLSVVFKAGLQPEQQVPDVRMESTAQRLEPAAANDSPPPPPPAPAAIAPEADAPSPGQPAEWRGDPKTWLAEIERLRASGEQARADAELAEFNRMHRAYAASPDR